MRKGSYIFTLIVIIIVQLINPCSLGITTVSAEATNPPDFLITRAMDKEIYNQWDKAKITYNITPTGQYTPLPQSASDIIIAMNIYSGMSSTQLSYTKNAAIDFINKIKTANAGNKIGFVSFGYKVNKTIPLTDNLDYISSYITGINSSSMVTGSNFQDALEKSQLILEGSTTKNKYIVFISDGYADYFTSYKWLGKYNNKNTKYENGVYYYTDTPKVTQPAYDNATTACNTLANKGIVLYSVGIGSGANMTFLRSMSQATRGEAYQTALPDSVVQVMTNKQSGSNTVKLSGLVIKDKLPEGITVTSDSGVVPDSLGNISIVLPDILYSSDGTTPTSFTYVLEVSLDNAGSYTLSNAGIDYLDIDSTTKSKPINDLSFTVNPNNNPPPGLTVNKQISKTELIEGEIASLTYTITPTGSFYKGAARKPLDMVIAIDRSYGMYEGNKLVNSKQEAESLVNIFKTANQGDRISLVIFNRYSKIEIPLTTDYDAIINRIRQIEVDDGYGYDAGTNLEIGLKASETALEGSTNQKHIVCFTDGVPSHYTDTISTSTYVDYYYYSYYSGYTKQSVRYSSWYYEPSNVNFYGSSMLDYNLQYREYAYSNTNDRGYIDARGQANSIKSKGIMLDTVCATGGTDTNLSFMQELASIGGGNSYTTETSMELSNKYEAIVNGTAQVLKNITITEALPSNIEIIANPNVSVIGSTMTINVPNITFEKDKGTPAQITVSVDLRFIASGEYQLSNTSRLDYTNYDGNAATPISIPKLTVTVIKAAPINGDIKAYNGSKRVSAIRKGKFDTIISLYVVNSGKLNLKLNAVSGSEELYNSLSTTTYVWDSQDNLYKLTKTTEGIFITTDYQLAKGSYEMVVRFNIGDISEKSYFLQIDLGLGAANPSIRVDVVAMPILL